MMMAAAAPVELLVFELAGLRYAVPLPEVREVVRAVLITPLAGAPAVVEGLVDVRGELAVVYDLRLRFGHAPVPLHPDEMMVVVWTGDRLAAFRCGRVEHTLALPAEDIAGADLVSHVGAHVSGVARLADGPVVIHDLAAFLEQAERAELEDALVAYSEGR